MIIVFFFFWLCFSSYYLSSWSQMLYNLIRLFCYLCFIHEETESLEGLNELSKVTPLGCKRARIELSCSESELLTTRLYHRSDHRPSPTSSFLLLSLEAQAPSPH